MADVIQKDISTFIRSQFPSFYEEEGPVFIAFVETYYKWLESITPAATSNIGSSWVTVSAQNTYITGINTHFTTDFSSGDTIAVWRSPELYDNFVVNSVANDTLLIVETNPLFSNVKANYAFTEDTRNQLYNSRRILEYVDVDQTIPDFIVHFKEKYLNGIQFDTNVDIRLLLKHTLDLYRAKGTPQALELLFRIVFGTDIEVYYPGDDVFRLSSGVWVTPRYIEVTLSENSILLNNRQIVGSISGATAFVDRVIRRNVNGHLSDVLYVSAVNGTFVHGDILDFSFGDKLDPETRVSVLGSLSDIFVDLEGSGENFNIGDIVDVYSDTGIGGKARISSLVNRSGIVDFHFEDGGYAYTADANTEILISDHVLRISNVVVDTTLNPWINSYSEIFETISQPMASINYVSANGSFVAGDDIFTYHANNDVRGEGIVLDVSETNSTTGQIDVAVVSGNLTSGQFFTVGNAVAANVSAISGYTDTTATGNVIGVVDSLSVFVSNPNFNISVNETVLQKDDVGSVVAFGTVDRITTSSSNTEYILSNTSGVFRLGQSLLSTNGSTIGNTYNIVVSVGIMGIAGDFVSEEGNFVVTSVSNTHGSVIGVSSGSGLNFSISNTLIYTEDVLFDESELFDYASDELDSLASTDLYDVLAYMNVTFGRISSLEGVNKGALYTAAPIIHVYNKLSYPYNRQDYVLTTLSGNFTLGEEVIQLSTNARGLVVSSNNTVTHLKRLRFNPENDFIVTTNSTTVVTGVLSGKSANVVSIDYENDEPSGFDAEFDTSLAISNGSIATVSVIDSGFGFYSGQEVTLVNNTSSASGFAICSTIGTGSGYYKEKGGFLSDQKKLHDGYYYQDFSYDVRSSVTLDKYVDMLKQITHVAGTMNFASMLTSSVMDSELSVEAAYTIVGLSSATDGNVIIEGVGRVAGSSNVGAPSVTLVLSLGSVTGMSTVSSVSETGEVSSGSISGTSTTSATSKTFMNGVGAASSNSTANAPMTGVGTMIGNIVGISLAESVSQ